MYLIEQKQHLVFHQAIFSQLKSSFFKSFHHDFNHLFINYILLNLILIHQKTHYPYLENNVDLYEPKNNLNYFLHKI